MNKINLSTLSDIKNKYKTIFNLFDHDTIYFLTSKWLAHETYFPLLFYVLQNYNVSPQHVRQIFYNDDIKELVTTQHANLTKKEVTDRIENLKIFIEAALEQIDKQTA